MNHPSKIKVTEPGPFQKVTRLLAAPVIEPSQRAARIQAVEKDIVLPLRFLVVAILCYYFFFTRWFDIPGAATASEWTLNHAKMLKEIFVVYALLSLAVGATFIWSKHLTLRKIQWIVFTMGIIDGAMMGVLTCLTEGFGSDLYWVFLALVVRNAMAIPVALPQLVLNFLVSLAFLAGGLLAPLVAPPLDEDAWKGESSERMIVLIAWSLCCYGIQLLFEKQKRAEAEATEFAVRQERLRTAGRLAAEIAHQIKNPLGIITNAAFCLQRAVREGEMAVDEQIDIIREEVNRADQIITELMGYAQLAEGTVESLEVSHELDTALQEVFPPAAKYQVKINKTYDPALPALLMQKRHLSGVFVNILQNAREAMNGHGEIDVSAAYGENDSIRILITDNGPGIPADQIDKIFEAYFTTREKGTGLGLAIVKHNTEMYGGRVDVQSKLGMGTQFALEFPARILMRLSK
ncbi:MAG TPA: ATP-binding protein [Verrucomicrobiae bacterium]|nr:ATP-binding protein [Verrucomicrobiae bacterium]